MKERCDAALPPGSLHTERFTAAPQEGAAHEDADADADAAFEVEFRRTGRMLHVPADRSLLDVVREVVPEVSYACEAGYCGACETTVLSGEPLHRDSCLTEEQRATCGTMVICVGRSRSAKLVLDL